MCVEVGEHSGRQEKDNESGSRILGIYFSGHKEMVRLG